MPIGPDTSFLIGEIIATTLDLELKNRIPKLRGTRNIDDYHLYFQSIAEAEAALALLHTIARQMELDINDPKTEIISLPTTSEPSWKSDLRNLQIRSKGQPQSTDSVSLFDRAFEHSKHFTADSILTYAAKQVLSTEITKENWPLCEAMLLQAAVSEPTMLSILVDVYDKYAEFFEDDGPLSDAIHSICSYHAPLQQGNEVSWALWLAKKTGIMIMKSVADKITKLDDDISALVSLDLQEHGLFESADMSLWEGNMNASNLQDAHWLLAYESQQHDWTTAGAGYVEGHEFFTLPSEQGVRFYSDELASTSSHSDYDEHDEADSEDETSLDEEREP